MENEVGSVDDVSWNFAFKWQIPNFSSLCRKPHRYNLISPKFTSKYMKKDIEWFLTLYPKGSYVPNSNYLSLYLNSKSRIKAVGSFIIYNNKADIVENATMMELEFGSRRWGYESFILRRHVLNPKNGILDNDTLTIVCKIKYVKNEKIKSLIGSRNTSKHQYVVEDGVSLYLEDEYMALVNSGKFHDVSLVVEGRLLKVHKCILAQSSSVFDAILEIGAKEMDGNDTIEISKVKYDVFLEMLRFIYAGKVNDIDIVAGELAIAADKYKLNGLKIVCEKAMSKDLKLDNAIKYLEIAERICMNKLKEDAIEFIVENADDVSEKAEFNLLSRGIVCEVFRCMANKKSKKCTEKNRPQLTQIPPQLIEQQTCCFNETVVI